MNLIQTQQIQTHGGLNEREAPYGFISFADIDGDGSVELSDHSLAHVDPLLLGI